MRGLVVGRFQPFHLGHVRAVEYVASQVDYVLVGIGSSNRSGSVENPFSFDERLKMIASSLKLNVGYDVAGIPDFNDDVKWMAWVMKNLEFDVYYGNAERELGLFRKAGCKVREAPFFHRGVYSATEVRRRILEGLDWRGLVPAGTAAVLEECGGVERLRKLSGRG